MQKLLELEELNLDATRVTGPGIEWLGSIPNLRSLSLRDSGIDDASLRYLRNLDGLEFLDLSDTDISDAGIVHLQQLTKLQEVNLESTDVSALALSQLAGLKELNRVRLTDLDLSRADLADRNVLREKEAYAARRRVVADPQLLGAILRAWKERQKRTLTFDVGSTGVRRWEGSTYNFEQRCAVDSQDRVRLSREYVTLPTRFNKLLLHTFNGRFSQLLSTYSHAERPSVYEYPLDTVKWHRFEYSLPLALAFRPLAGLLDEKNLAVTRDVRVIDGHECVELYHAGGKVWVDPSRNYLPLRFSYIIRGRLGNQYDVRYRADENGEEIPTGWIYSGPDDNGRLTMREEVGVTHCILNEPVAAEVFQITPTSREPAPSVSPGED